MKQFFKVIRKKGPLAYFIKREERELDEDSTDAVEVDSNGDPVDLEYLMITETVLNQNEYCPEPVKKPKLKPHTVVDDDYSSFDEDENFDWYDADKYEKESYFCYVNQERRTIQKGEQAYYCYGCRSNKDLLTNYGFCFADNRYDSYSIMLKMKVDIMSEADIPSIIDFKGAEFTQEVRFKTDQISQIAIGYFRLQCKKAFASDPDFVKDKVLLTKPYNLKYERFCVTMYVALLRLLQANLEKSNSLEDDQLTLQDSTLEWTTKMSLLYRIEKKKIIHNQLDLCELVMRLFDFLDTGLASDESMVKQVLMTETA